MEFQNSLSRESFHSNYYQNTDTYEYTLLSSISDLFLSIDSFQSQLAASSPSHMRLTNTLKKLSQSSPLNLSTFFTYLPPVLKKNFTPNELFTVLNEDFSAEFKDFVVTFASIPVSDLISSSLRSQELLNQRISKKDSKLAIFELAWDTEVSMDSVVKVLKNVPTSFQSTFNYELAGMVVGTGGYFTGIAKSGENWKILGEFMDPVPVPWIKLAWFLVSSVKFPVVLLYQRVDGYKSSLNFLSSVECEKLSQFATKQDRCVKIISKRMDGYKEETTPSSSLGFKANIQSSYKDLTPSVQNSYKDLTPNIQSSYKDLTPSIQNSYKELTPSIQNNYKDTEQGVRPGSDYKSRTAPYDSTGIEDFSAAKNRIELLEAKLRSPSSTSSFIDKGFNEGYKDSKFIRQDDYKTTAYSQHNEEGYKGSKIVRTDDYKTTAYTQNNEEGYKSSKFIRPDDYKPTLYTPNNEEVYKFSKFVRPDDYKPAEYTQHSENWKDERGFGRMRESKNEEFFNQEERQKFSYTPSRDALKVERFKSRDFDNNENKEPLGRLRFSSVERPIVRSSYLKPEDARRDLNERSRGADRTDFRTKMQDQYQNFKEKYKFLDDIEKPLQNPSKYNSETASNEEIRNEYQNPYLRNYAEPEKDQINPVRSYKPTVDLSNSKSQDGFSQFHKYKADSRSEIYAPNEKLRPTSEYSLNQSIEIEDFKRFSNEKPNSRPDSESPLEHSRRIFSDKPIEDQLSYKPSEKFLSKLKKPEQSDEYFLNRSIDHEDSEKYTKDHQKHIDRNEKSYSTLSKYSSIAPKPREAFVNKPINEPLRRKFIRTDSTPNPALEEKYVRSSGDYNARKGRVADQSQWNCGRCNKALDAQMYECSECRLINWDQFYKVKSIQQPIKSELLQYDSVSRQEGSKNVLNAKPPEEESDWVCSACYNTNKGLFFLCKSCRKPKNYGETSKVHEYN